MTRDRKGSTGFAVGQTGDPEQRLDREGDGLYPGYTQPRVPKVFRGSHYRPKSPERREKQVIRTLGQMESQKSSKRLGRRGDRLHSQPPNGSETPFKDPAPAWIAAQTRPDPRASPLPSCPSTSFYAGGQTQLRGGQESKVECLLETNEEAVQQTPWLGRPAEKTGHGALGGGCNHGREGGRALRKQRVRCTDTQRISEQQRMLGISRAAHP